MEKDELAKDGLRELQRRIGVIFDQVSQNESQELKAQTKQLIQKYSKIIEHTRTMSPRNADRFCEEVGEQLSKLLCDTICRSRNASLELTNNYLNSVKAAPDLANQLTQKKDVVCSNAKYYVTANDNKCNDNIEDICNRAVQACQRQLIRIDMPRTPETIADIRRVTKEACVNMQRTHKVFSEDVAKDIVSGIEQVVGHLSVEDRVKVSQEVEKKATGLMADLESNKINEKQLLANDVKEFSDNEAQFKGSELRSQSKREDLEAMFK